MAKGRHDEQPPTSKTPLILLGIGCLLVAVLIGWALTRTVETPVTPVAESPAGQPVPETPISGTNPTDTAATALPPGRPEVHGDRAEVRRMAVEDLKAKFDRGAVTVIDTRDAASFAASHIPGALNIPLPSIEASLDSIPRDKEIVAYCT